MVNTSVSISDEGGELSAIKHREYQQWLIEVRVTTDSGKFLLDRKEAISFGHALIALGESL
jgi:hypothetical protein